LNLAFTLVGSCLVADTTLTLTDHHDPHVKTESIQSGLIGLSEPDNLCFITKSRFTVSSTNVIRFLNCQRARLTFINKTLIT
jgi:hypothetical protein